MLSFFKRNKKNDIPETVVDDNKAMENNNSSLENIVEWNTSSIENDVTEKSSAKNFDEMIEDIKENLKEVEDNESESANAIAADDYMDKKETFEFISGEYDDDSCDYRETTIIVDEDKKSFDDDSILENENSFIDNILSESTGVRYDTSNKNSGKIDENDYEKNISIEQVMVEETGDSSNEEASETVYEEHSYEKIDQQKSSAISNEDVDKEANNQNSENPNDEVFEQKKIGFFTKVKNGLSKTRDNILGGVETVLSAFTVIDEELFEELEESLILSDMGVDTSLYIIDELRKTVKRKNVTDVADIKSLLVNIISDVLSKDVEPLEYKTPTVVLVIGVNGAGKTTTIGKLTHNIKNQGKSVMLCAADTFRAAAIEQLEIWADRNEVPIIKNKENTDPASVVFDACNSAKSKNTDVLIIDTAGRLQNKKNLMEELKKINRIINKEYANANIEVLLVLDGTTGQNALSQAKLFNETADITGLVITKLDGTAKGGVIVSISNEMKIPVRYVGLGEKIDDLEPFDSKEFAKALFEGDQL